MDHLHNNSNKLILVVSEKKLKCLTYLIYFICSTAKQIVNQNCKT